MARISQQHICVLLFVTAWFIWSFIEMETEVLYVQILHDCHIQNFGKTPHILDLDVTHKLPIGFMLCRYKRCFKSLEK